ncbi:MAG: hypothetical protein M1819_006789 [Sarea resinae]|nr:MAG: hypothetical protein M1819_006789 [Sarea resinae]
MSSPHSKEEESARTLLEMKGAQALAHTVNNKDDRVASSQVLAESSIQSQPELQGGSDDVLQEKEGSHKRSKSSKKKRLHNDRLEEEAKTASAPNASTQMPEHLIDSLLEAPNPYPKIERPPQYPSGALAIADTSDYPPLDSSSNGHTTVAPTSHDYESQTVYDLPDEQASASYGNGPEESSYSYQQTERQYGSSSSPNTGKRKRKRGLGRQSQSAVDLANAASAANALIDPALTAQSEPAVTSSGIPADGTHDTGPSQDVPEQSNHSAHPSRSKRKRRLPDPDNLDQNQKRVRKSGGPSTPASRIMSTPSSQTRSANGGPFTDLEIELLTRFLEGYRDEHGISQFDLNEKIQETGRSTGSKDEFWNEVAAVLPYRTRQSIYKVCRRRFHNFGKRGKWTAEEDEMLRVAQEQKPNKWKAIGEMIGRMPEDCRDRWRNYLKCGENMNKDVWTQHEEDMLKDAVNDCHKRMRESKANEGNKDVDEEENMINWAVVSEKMGGMRSRLQCLYKWKKLLKRAREEEHEQERAQLIAEGKLDSSEIPQRKHTWRTKRAEQRYAKMLPGDKYELLQALANSGTYEEKNIPWKIIGTPEYRNIWSTTDRKTAFRHLKERVPDNESNTLQETVAAALSHLVAEYPNSLDDHYNPAEDKQLVAKASRRNKREKHLSAEAIVDEDDEDDEEPDNENENENDTFRDYEQAAEYTPSESNMVGPELDQTSYAQQHNQGPENGGYVGPALDVDEEMAERVGLLREA